MNQEAERLERLFKALASRKRLTILETLLEKKEMHVGEISERLNSSMKGISRNLLILQTAGFLSSRNTRNYVKYSIRSEDVHPDNLLALTIVRRNLKSQKGKRKATKLISALTVDPYLGKILKAAEDLVRD